ncbi:MAG: VWA domain-containing protein, partial [Anaerolineales bacterium]
AVRRVLRRLPPGHYNTDLGRCLEALVRDHPEAVSSRTTVVFCADARNNFRPPREDLLEQVARRAHRVVWFNPEAPHLWGTEDSDMLRYAPRVSAVRQVSNLRQLGDAIDRLFA